jgi:DUF438 domain-containing protein
VSEFINNSEKRKELLKHMTLQLHAGEAPAEARNQLVSLLTNIPYGEVVEVEQELISEKVLSEAEVLKFCDIHSEALDGHIDLSGMKIIPPGHPVDTFKRENKELLKVCDQLEDLYKKSSSLKSSEEISAHFLKLKSLFNSLMDVEKHYLRKENLVFPYMEKYSITGPPKVMWGKHNEIRKLLKASIEVLDAPGELTPEEVVEIVGKVFKPASDGVADMTMKEEQIIEDFRSGKQDHAPFWIQMKGKSIYIEYYALRDENGEYLGTLEVSQDLTEKRALEGEQRILEYKGNTGQDIPKSHETTTDEDAGKPSWLKQEKIVKKLDARPIIMQGGHPLGEVMTGVAELKPGEIYQLETPFPPAPLIERVVALGFDNWSEKKAEDYFINYFLKNNYEQSEGLSQQ